MRHISDTFASWWSHVFWPQIWACMLKSLVILQQGLETLTLLNLQFRMCHQEQNHMKRMIPLSHQSLLNLQVEFTFWHKDVHNMGNWTVSTRGVFLVFMRRMDIWLCLFFCRVNNWCRKWNWQHCNTDIRSNSWWGSASSSCFSSWWNKRWIHAVEQQQWCNSLYENDYKVCRP